VRFEKLQLKFGLFGSEGDHCGIYLRILLE